jgi:hypothetical protein
MVLIRWEVALLRGLWTWIRRGTYGLDGVLYGITLLDNPLLGLIA